MLLLANVLLSTSVRNMPEPKRTSTQNKEKRYLNALVNESVHPSTRRQHENNQRTPTPQSKSSGRHILSFFPRFWRRRLTVAKNNPAQEYLATEKQNRQKESTASKTHAYIREKKEELPSLKLSNIHKMKETAEQRCGDSRQQQLVTTKYEQRTRLFERIVRGHSLVAPQTSLAVGATATTCNEKLTANGGNHNDSGRLENNGLVTTKIEQTAKCDKDLLQKPPVYLPSLPRMDRAASTTLLEGLFRGNQHNRFGEGLVLNKRSPTTPLPPPPTMKQAASTNFLIGNQSHRYHCHHYDDIVLGSNSIAGHMPASAKFSPKYQVQHSNSFYRTGKNGGGEAEGEDRNSELDKVLKQYENKNQSQDKQEEKYPSRADLSPQSIPPPPPQKRPPPPPPPPPPPLPPHLPLQVIKPSVSFHLVHVREYERVIGDNPSCSTGPPISLGWTYAESSCCNVEDFENRRRRKRLVPRTKKDFYLPAKRRSRILIQEWLYHEDEIRKACREVAYTRFCRERERKAASNIAPLNPDGCCCHSETNPVFLRKANSAAEI